MSNFNRSQFNSAFAMLVCKSDERAEAVSIFLADSISAACESTLIDGSDSLAHVLNKISNSGKTSVAVKVRKAVRAIDWSPINDWFNVDEFDAVKASGYIGGNSSKCTDQKARISACEVLRDNVAIACRKVFTPAAKDAGHVDPLASFGAYSEKTIALKLATASASEMMSACERLRALEALITTAMSALIDTADAAPADAAPADAAQADAAPADYPVPVPVQRKGKRKAA